MLGEGIGYIILFYAVFHLLTSPMSVSLLRWTMLFSTMKILMCSFMHDYLLMQIAHNLDIG